MTTAITKQGVEPLPSLKPGSPESSRETSMRDFISPVQREELGDVCTRAGAPRADHATIRNPGATAYPRPQRKYLVDCEESRLHRIGRAFQK